MKTSSSELRANPHTPKARARGIVLASENNDASDEGARMINYARELGGPDVIEYWREVCSAWGGIKSHVLTRPPPGPFELDASATTQDPPTAAASFQLAYERVAVQGTHPTLDRVARRYRLVSLHKAYLRADQNMVVPRVTKGATPMSVRITALLAMLGLGPLGSGNPAYKRLAKNLRRARVGHAVYSSLGPGTLGLFPLNDDGPAWWWRMEDDRLDIWLCLVPLVNPGFIAAGEEVWPYIQRALWGEAQGIGLSSQSQPA